MANSSLFRFLEERTDEKMTIYFCPPSFSMRKNSSFLEKLMLSMLSGKKKVRVTASPPSHDHDLVIIESYERKGTSFSF